MCRPSDAGTAKLRCWAAAGLHSGTTPSQLNELCTPRQRVLNIACNCMLTATRSPPVRPHQFARLGRGTVVHSFRALYTKPPVDTRHQAQLPSDRRVPAPGASCNGTASPKHNTLQRPQCQYVQCTLKPMRRPPCHRMSYCLLAYVMTSTLLDNFLATAGVAHLPLPPLRPHPVAPAPTAPGLWQRNAAAQDTLSK